MPPRRITISRRARSDLREIREYTRRQWGAQQATDYVRALRKSIRSLSDYPLLGKPFEAGNLSLLRRMLRQHMVYYRVDEDQIEILRIVHARRDADELFD